jgi:hypothetical protein
MPVHLRGTGESFAANIGGHLGSAASSAHLPPRPRNPGRIADCGGGCRCFASLALCSLNGFPSLRNSLRRMTPYRRTVVSAR